MQHNFILDRPKDRSKNLSNLYHAKKYHFLSRATFGSTKESMQKVNSIGIESWLDEQLHPEQINNNRAEQFLGSLPSLDMSATELLRAYPRPEPGETPTPGKEFWRPFLELTCATLLLARHSERYTGSGLDLRKKTCMKEGTLP